MGDLLQFRLLPTDFVGCFSDPPASLPLKRPPQHPNVIQTGFHLYTRGEVTKPDIIQYGDQSQSLVQSRFNTSKQLKVIIHGYKGSASDPGAIFGATSLLALEDANVIMLDWTRGAATTYAIAVANTELVGRQLALVLLDIINLGSNPNAIHIIGFSLGAHIAGCASEVLKRKKYLLGRITGLDPASPFFRHNVFRDRSRKLDISDARLVDIVHTDGSEDFADGFGLLKPLGHIDFFPNGGQQQPGCKDVKNSVVVSHLQEEFLDRKIACSHLRAWQLFVESLWTQKRDCKFVAWPCPKGIVEYASGKCFPMENQERAQELGYVANNGPLGIYYLATRGEEPFCGQPLRASVLTLNSNPKTSGVLFLKIFQEQSVTTFKIYCPLPKRRNESKIFYDIRAGEFDQLSSNVTTIQGLLWYRVLHEQGNTNETEEDNSETLWFDRVVIEDRKGNKWQHCNSNDSPADSREIQINLNKVPCEK